MHKIKGIETINLSGNNLADCVWNQIIESLQSAENRISKIILDDNQFKIIPAEFFIIFKKVNYAVY